MDENRRSVCNDTKWNELREAMIQLPAALRPRWQSTTLDGYVSDYDGEWFYHFALGGFKDILHVDIKSLTEAGDVAVNKAISQIGLMTTKPEGLVVRVHGYLT
jgi:hypothetical protein